MIWLIPTYLILIMIFGKQFFAVLCVTTLFGGVYEHFAYFMASYLHGKISYRPFGAPTKKIIDNPIMTGAPLYTIGHYITICAYAIMSNYIDSMVFNFFFYGTLLTTFEYIAGWLMNAGPKVRDGIHIKQDWDYSEEFMNLHGIISLRHFIIWCLFSQLSLIIHPLILSSICM